MINATLFCLALNIYHESRGEPLPGQFAVAEVTLRRAQSPRWRGSVCSVTFQHRQFAWSARPMRDLMPADAEAWRLALEVAELAALDYRGRGVATVCADHFHSGPAPSWAASMQVEAVIGGHVFYCDEGLR